MTVGEALNIIRREGVGERVIYFYIINDEGQLAGIIPTRRLLTATPQRTIADVMITDVITISDRALRCKMLAKCSSSISFLRSPIVDDLKSHAGVLNNLCT